SVDPEKADEDLRKWEKRRRAEARRLMRDYPEKVAAANHLKQAIRESVGARLMYDGDWFAYDFEHGLRQAEERETMRDLLRPWLSQVELLARADEFDAAAQGKHIALVVGAVHEEPGAEVARSTKRRRHTTKGLREQVRDLHRRGVVVAAIADTLNVSDRRVRQ